jgi:hypothetical protein
MPTFIVDLAARVGRVCRLGVSPSALERRG